ncbi:MAG: monovalent cation/H+ antiporter subunit A [Betaproteobacteria bacterium]|nr:monovalent cation/H+ antiporter subunit A [Betaproteobacteria bacterium]MDH5342776.1 monovalent cation/H+ antiporter subunit A [Betaproteobacteria bacterium]
MTLPIIILLPLIAGTMLALPAARFGRNAVAWTVAAVTAGSLMLLLRELPGVMDGRPLIMSWEWLPAIGLNLSFRLDGLGLIFALLILGIGLLIILYARYYLSATDSAGKFYALLMLFMAAMLGIVLSENLLMLFFFWELTSISSFLLIGYWNHRSDARRGARMALTITGAGGLAMFAGFLLIGNIAGSFELTKVLEARDLIHDHPLYVLALVLVLLGAFTKSAQFPFHFWLPQAMAAPTPVSAYLHSATMVKAGVFLLARMYPVLGNSLEFEWIVTTVGLVTMVYAAYVAVFQHDLKGLLAYSTISHLGLITFLLGLDSPLSAIAAVFHIINHATFKASLFMAAGIIDHECGTRDMRRLSGLWKYMPYTATLAMVAAAAMAGVPLFNGFLSKEMFFAEALELHDLGLLGKIAPIAVTLGAIFSVAYSLRFIHDVFFDGEPKDLERKPHEPPRYMKVPVEVLVVICIAVGMLPGLTVAPLLAVAARDVFGAELPPYDIAIWHGLTIPLMMSAIALAAGILLYWLLRRHNLHMHPREQWTAPQLFHRGFEAVVALSAVITGRLQNGSLQRYLRLLVIAIAILGLWPFLQHGYIAGAAALTPAPPLAITVWGITLVAAIASVALHHQRFTAIILVGVVGLSASLTFAYFSAPDLALTQLSVEVVTTALLLVALSLMPQSGPLVSHPTDHTRDALLAIGAGAGVTAITWAVLTRAHESISWYFINESVPKGGGSNIVNVILVDFRSFDTFGEIIVLGIAGVGVLLMMDGLRPHAGAPATRNDQPLLSAAARVLLPFALLVSAFIFLRGHNLPGGGFIAGLVTATALIIQYIADGMAATSRRLGDDATPVVGVGVLIAGLTGVASWLFDAPFLTSTYAYFQLPLLGAVPLASALAFDLGVYLTVVGATLLMLVRLGKVTGPVNSMRVEAS